MPSPSGIYCVTMGDDSMTLRQMIIAGILVGCGLFGIICVAFLAAGIIGMVI